MIPFWLSVHAVIQLEKRVKVCVCDGFMFPYKADAGSTWQPNSTAGVDKWTDGIGSAFRLEAEVQTKLAGR